ncbi:hypothetical protein [Marinomonas gallaica]|uniref:hypothetical protein n=1 Tax=Marinomonas gallaica TaxID=1806667 RepID=UPI00082CE403|nr:hypothetical protein [Marinomonas gallaica]
MTSNSQVLYGRIVSILEQLLDEEFVTEALEELSDNEHENELTAFEVIVDKLEIHLNNIKEHQAEDTVYKEMEDLKGCVSSITGIDIGVDYPINKSESLILIDFLCYIFSNIEEIDSDLGEIKFYEFEIINNLPDQIESFFHHDLSDLNRSMMFFSVSDSIPSLVEKGLNPILATVIISFFSYGNGSNKNLIMKKCSDGMSNEKALSILKLYMVCSGRKFHSIREVGQRNLNHFISKIDFRNDYQQFSESLIVLSEYNSRKEILNKYISLYHLVENFMFKYPLVKLNRDRGGQMFSIRDFKDMYSKIDTSELQSLENFLKVALDTPSGTSTLYNDVYDRFLNLTSTGSMTESDVNSVFSKFNISTKKKVYEVSDFANSNQNTKTEFLKMTAKLIYVFRNSIVHNKETEFHLSHETLSDRVCEFMENYLLPMMEDVLYSLLVEHNGVVWYKHQNIRLFA